jgi:capsular exopolysaccharide synthesis family protein
MDSGTAKNGNGHNGSVLDWYSEDGEYPAQRAFGLAELRAMAWRRRGMIGVLLAFAVIAGLVITLLMTPMFRATTTVRIDNESLQVVEGQEVTPLVSVMDTDRYINTQMEVLQSSSMALRVADSLNLAQNDEFLSEAGIGPLPGDIPEAQAVNARRQIIAEILREGVSAEVAQRNRIASIQFDSRSPVYAARIANAYAENFISENVRGQFDANSYAKDILEEQVAEAQARLRETEIQAVEYARRNGLIDTSAGGGEEGEESGATSIVTANLTQLNQNYIEARSNRIMAEQRWRAAEATSPLELAEARQNAALQAVIGDRATAQAQLDKLRQRYLDDHPQVEQAKAEVNALTNEINRMAGQVRNSLRTEYRIAQRQEEQLTEARTQLANETLAEQDRRVQYGMLSSDAQNQRLQLAELQRRLSQVNSASDVAANNITMVDAASVPADPFTPNFPRNMLISLVLGLAVGCGLALLREAFDDALHSPEDAEAKLGLPLLGTTPLVAEDETDIVGGEFDELAEAYYSVRAATDFATGGNRNKVIQITSCQPGEGKSTTAVALALDYARIGRRVILLDGDLRKPTLHRRLGLSREVGWISALMNEVPLDGAIQSLGPDKPDVLPLGPTPPNPVQLLSGEQMGKLIERLRGKYDIVLIDSPPVMGLADAPLIARHADHTVLIVEAGRAHYGAARAAIRRLHESGANLVGIVMTKFDFRNAGYGYDYHYSYYRYTDREDRPATA